MSHDERSWRIGHLDTSNLVKAVRPFVTDSPMTCMRLVMDPVETDQTAIRLRNPKRSETFPVDAKNAGYLQKNIHQTIHRFRITCDIPCVRAIPPWLKGWVDTSCVFCESDWVKSEEFPLLAALPTRGPFPRAALSLGR